MREREGQPMLVPRGPNRARKAVLAYVVAPIAALLAVAVALLAVKLWLLTLAVLAAGAAGALWWRSRS